MPITRPVLAFVDRASIHSALSALIGGKKTETPDWERQSLLESTYLLLHSSVNIMPAPGPYAGAVGFFGNIVSAFPELETYNLNRSTGEGKTRHWLARYPDAIKQAWINLQDSANLDEWAERQRDIFWATHVQMYTALFNSEYIPRMSLILGCSPTELTRVHALSRDVNAVKRWVKQPQSEDAQIAHQAWLLSALIRGKFHEYLARENNLQLIAHPFRTGVGKVLRVGLSQEVLNSEEQFTKIVLGSALIETEAGRRVNAWIENVRKARTAIATRKIALPEAATISDAEEFAVMAARKIGLATQPALVHRALDAGIAIGLGILVRIAIAPWLGPAGVAIGPMAAQAYKHLRGSSIGDDLAKHMLSTNRRFRTIIRSVPGRIEREIRTPQ